MDDFQAEAARWQGRVAELWREYLALPVPRGWVVQGVDQFPSLPPLRANIAGCVHTYLKWREQGQPLDAWRRELRRLDALLPGLPDPPRVYCRHLRAMAVVVLDELAEAPDSAAP